MNLCFNSGSRGTYCICMCAYAYVYVLKWMWLCQHGVLERDTGRSSPIWTPPTGWLAGAFSATRMLESNLYGRCKGVGRHCCPGHPVFMLLLSVTCRRARAVYPRRQFLYVPTMILSGHKPSLSRSTIWGEVWIIARGVCAVSRHDASPLGSAGQQIIRRI